ncbi:DUF6998 domain-containing protein [Novosphingobium sp. RL4]|uniref:DUF6998 domain-containing protein n=1 Tax=Novosphingobium sp. RL4 TaxID=3109595 RepID=UPI002D792EF9|nr:hypothetical protein [Novosphingobium sp. RL4]WRT94054.1 hypothetical protein U9J33_05970 [Novosphingobium sp. RL4]
MPEVDWAEVRNLLDSLYGSAEPLETLFPGRKFTLDGHLVGSIGEVIAAYMFVLTLNPASTMAHDALCAAASTPDGARRRPRPLLSTRQGRIPRSYRTIRPAKLTASPSLLFSFLPFSPSHFLRNRNLPRHPRAIQLDRIRA